MLLLALVMVAREAYPTLFAPGGLWGLLIADAWEPLSQPARLGVRHAWLSTVAATSVALAFAVPVGFGIGIFIAEIAPSIVKKMLQPCLELLAGIPSVVYGFFGYVTLVPAILVRGELWRRGEARRPRNGDGLRDDIDLPAQDQEEARR